MLCPMQLVSFKGGSPTTQMTKTWANLLSHFGIRTYFRHVKRVGAIPDPAGPLGATSRAGCPDLRGDLERDASSESSL
eukprot:4398024-Pyramimonas_sp.AAC.1